MHREVGLRKKITLVIEKPDITMAELNMRAECSADNAGRKQLLDTTHGSLPAVVFVNKERSARFPARAHHGLAGRIIHCHWFLTNDRQATACGEENQCRVSFRADRHV